jgi:hypothetical protein
MPVCRQFRPRFEDVERTDVSQRENVVSATVRLDHLPHMSVRHLAADEGDILHTSHSDIGDKHAMSEQVARILLAQQIRSDPTVGGRVIRHIVTLQSPFSPGAICTGESSGTSRARDR